MRQERKFKKRRFIGVVIGCISLFLISLAGGFYIYKNKNLDLSRFKQVQVVIAEGETIWEKESELLNEKEDIRLILEYVKKINNKENLNVTSGEEIILLQNK